MAMDLRTRAGVGVVAVLALAGCAPAADSVVGSAASIVTEIKDSRVREKAPGTWACEELAHREEPGGGTMVEPVGRDAPPLVVTIHADGRYGYERKGTGTGRGIGGVGTWTLDGGELSLKTSIEGENDRGYLASGVHDASTALSIERVEFRTNGSAVPRETKPVEASVEVVSDDHVRFGFGRGYVWSCERDASVTPIDVPGSIPGEPASKKGELVGRVRLDPAPAGEPDYPSIVVREVVEPGAMEDLGAFPDVADDGTFSIELPPGDYTVGSDESSEPNSDDFRCQWEDVTITQGQTTTVEVEC